MGLVTEGSLKDDGSELTAYPGKNVTKADDVIVGPLLMTV